MWCLNFHAAYACRHSGECCRAGWPIPFGPAEAARVESLRLVDAPAFVRADGPDAAILAATHADGRCIFFEPATHLCAIHRTAGEAALPITCRVFPRVVLKDARGAFLTLSHYCPTAASLLLHADQPTAIVDAPASLVPAGPLEGLDASDAWPPLLRPRVLMDHAGYALWERRAIALLADPDLSPRRALEAIEAATTALVRWSPGGMTLSDAVARSFETIGPGDVPGSEADGSLVSLVLRAVPAKLLNGTPFTSRPSRTPDADVALEYAEATGRWLSARLFGTWLAYQGSGLRAIVRYLRACLAVLLVELARDPGPRSGERRFIDAIRRSDHLIVHLADSQRLATLLSSNEGLAMSN